MLTTSAALLLLVTLAAYAALGVTQGLLAYAATEFFRKVPVLEGWALSGRRPLSCDFCMAFWTSAMWSAILLSFGDGFPWLGRLVVFGVSIATCLIALGWASALPPPDPPSP